jgi:hypothetical protein
MLRVKPFLVSWLPEGFGGVCFFAVKTGAWFRNAELVARKLQ